MHAQLRIFIFVDAVVSDVYTSLQVGVGVMVMKTRPVVEFMVLNSITS